MATEIDYSVLEGNAKQAKALADVVNWLTWEKFVQYSNDARADFETGLTYQQFRFAVSIAGISGYPAKAWWNFLFGDVEQ